MIDAMKGTENIPGFLQESVGFYTRAFLAYFDDLEGIIHQPKVDNTEVARCYKPTTANRNEFIQAIS